MKKENRKLAQEQRAAARKKKQKRDQLEKNFMITMVVAVILMFVVFIGADMLMSDDSEGEGSQGNAVLKNDENLKVEDGDKIRIDFVGSIDGVEFEGGNTNGQGVDLWVGSGSMIDDFEEQLIGAHPGETVDVYVTFPDEYSKDESLEGKEALFKVTVHGIYR